MLDLSNTKMLVPHIHSPVPVIGVMGEVKLCEKMAQFDTKKCAVASLKRIAQGKERVHGKRKRNPWLSGKKKKKRWLPQLLKGSWTNVNRKWLLSPRPKG